MKRIALLILLFSRFAVADAPTYYVSTELRCVSLKNPGVSLWVPQDNHSGQDRSAYLSFLDYGPDFSDVKIQVSPAGNPFKLSVSSSDKVNSLDFRVVDGTTEVLPKSQYDGPSDRTIVFNARIQFSFAERISDKISPTNGTTFRCVLEVDQNR